MPSYLAHVKTSRSRVTTLRALLCDDDGEEALRQCLRQALEEWRAGDVERVEVYNGAVLVLDVSGVDLSAIRHD